MTRPGIWNMPAGLGENVPGTRLPIAPLIRRLAETLDVAGIEWVVLRNAAELPDYTRYDIDLLVAPQDLPRFLQTLEACAQATGWRIAGRIRKRHYLCLLLVQGDPAGVGFFLPVDVFTALEFRGLRYLETDSVLKARVQTPAGIWTLPPGLEAAITLLKEWLPHRILKENSRTAVETGARTDPDRFRTALEAAAGPDLGSRLADAVQRGEWSLAPADARDLRRQIRRRTPRWPGTLLLATWANLAHLFRPSLGLVVCLAGADGSGKTTLARGLAEQTFKRPFKACRYVHGNIGVLPRFRDIRARLARLAGRRPPDPPEEPPTLKGMMAPIPAWKSMLLAAYYAFDLVLARPLLRRWRGQWTLVVMDRSFYDYYYQRGHRRCPRWFLDFLARLIPKPDRLLCLTGNAERIHERKPELTVAEIQIEQEILHELAGRLPFARQVDGGQGADAMIAAGRREVLAALFGRETS